MKVARTLVSSPGSEPVSLAEAKSHLDQDHAADDVLITDLIEAARRYAEKRTWRAFVTQTWDFFWDRFPVGNGCIELPLPPLQTVTHVKYRDPDGVLQTLDASNYNVLAAEEPGLVEPAYNTTWPTTRDQKHAVTVRAVVGYGDATDVPTNYRQGMLLLIRHWYDNPAAVVTGTVATEVKLSVAALLDVDHARAMVG